jgi:hypothetical protein
MSLGRKYCKICTSPYRGEIEELKKRKVSMSDIGRRYHKLFNVNEANFYATITRHFVKKHPPVIKNDPVPIEERKHIDFNEYADMLLQEGASSIANNPGKVSHSHVIAAKRTLLEEEKIRNQSDALKMAMLKFFRGELVEGEVVDDTKQLGAEAVPADTK